MPSFETEIKVPVRIEYSYSPGTKDYFSQSHGNWLPGDPPEVSDVKVFLMVTLAITSESSKEKRSEEINIYPLLEEETREEVIECCFEDAGGDK